MILTYAYKASRKVGLICLSFYSNGVSKLKFYLNNVSYGRGMIMKGPVTVDIEMGGKMVVGNDFRVNSGSYYNKIGRQQRTAFVVKKGASIRIGNNVGMSSTYLVCHESIIIGNGVKIGGNVVIYDTDFHSTNAEFRADRNLDVEHAKTAPVIISDNVFIGAHSTILKGVSIGRNSIIGAGSVVSRSIPENQIWAGNPAKFIRDL